MNFDKFLEIFATSELVDNKVVIKDRLHEAIAFIKENYPFDILLEIIANHQKDGFVELNYHLYSSIDEEDLFISIAIENDVETITDIFPSAIADEREIFDLFGIQFIGHKDLKRLYMPESWEGFPLRKDYIQDDTRLCWNDENNA